MQAALRSYNYLIHSNKTADETNIRRIFLIISPNEEIDQRRCALRTYPQIG